MTATRIALVLAWALTGCVGETGGGDPVKPATPTNPSDPTEPVNDPFAACVDAAKCCTAADMECAGNPDGQPICKCYKLWDCSKNPKKCDQETPMPPGDGKWTCTWTSQLFSCTGTSTSTPGGGQWSCSKESETTWTCTRPSPPNPSNLPGGVAVWKCVVAGATLSCERIEAPKPDAGVPVGKLDAGGVPSADAKPKADSKPAPDTKPVPPKKETNCADGIDNDGDGLIDCKDSDCPACVPQPCPAGKECCDGKDNNGNGQIDEGGACNGVAEPCPPGAIQACDCYCGVHRRCQANGTWGPCKVDGSCQLAIVTTQDQCGPFGYCDFGQCQGGFMFGQCKHHSDCPAGFICDLASCIPDPYVPACP